VWGDAFKYGITAGILSGFKKSQRALAWPLLLVVHASNTE
jgi:hypothetical protein